MIEKIITRNKKKFLEYNTIRKEMFAEFAPKDSEIILYLLPWLLSINHPDCPGYLPDIKTHFRVFNVAQEKGLKGREETFKEMFNLTEKGTMLRLKPKISLIQGLYTIGSAGTISQTPESDCDIWVCYDRNEYNGIEEKQLHQKVYLVKEWIDQNCKIPVYFFVSDINDIRNCRFGSVDEESSGSTQTNVLKEEFYRTCFVICGKIPLWWVCYDNRVSISYDKALKACDGKHFWDDDYVDLGNLENVEANEYFGAALWQLHKSLARPLKSIIKMMILKMQLDAPNDELICHKFRQHIMLKKFDNMIPDPSVFSMFFIMNYYQHMSDSETLSFIKECFYLRCEIKPYSKKFVLKKQLTDVFFSQFKIDRITREHLNRFSKWNLDLQIKFGRRIFMLLLQIYRDISESHSGVASKIDTEDLTVLGRKIQAYYEAKDHKVTILPKPMGVLNVSGMTFRLDSNMWGVGSGNEKEGQIVSDIDILYVITFIVRNGLFESGRVHMQPNRSSVTLQEIVNIGSQILSFFGTQVDHGIKNEDYLKHSYITKMLVVISFEQEPWEKNTSNIGLVYRNSWGEVFVRRFYSEIKLKNFLVKKGYYSRQVETDYYLQKKCINYSTIITLVRKLVEEL